MSTILVDAHKQWVKRPPDERFTSLDAILEFTGNRKRNALEETHSLRNLRLHATHGGGMFLNGHVPHAAFTNWSFSQLCQAVKAPAGYLRSLSAGMAVQCLEYGMARNGGEAKLLLRRNDTLDSDESNFGNAVSAFTSPTYGRIWDYEVISELLEAIRDLNWHPPDSKVGSAGLYASDRDMFVFLINDERPVEIGNARLGKGFFLWNSETGSATFGLTTFLYNFVCRNHIVWGAEEVRELKIVHRHHALSRFYSEAIPVLDRFVENKGLDDRIRETVGRAMDDRLGTTLEEVSTSLKVLPFTRNELAAAWNTGLAEGEDVTSRWGLMQGLSAYARALPFIDRRVSLERRAGALLSLQDVQNRTFCN